MTERSELDKLTKMKLHNAASKNYITAQIRDSIKGAKRFRTLKKTQKKELDPLELREEGL